MEQEWLSDRLVVIGTKCNHLLCLDVISGLTIEIPLPVARTQPATRSNPNPGLAAPSYGNCGIHAIAFSPDGRFMATGGFDPAHCQIYEVELSGPNNAHVSFRPAQTLVVSAAVVQACHLSFSSCCSQYQACNTN